MSADERALVLGIEGEEVVGVLHPAGGAARTGVVIVVGGPQYRVGSHRQFVLLARALAAAGFTTLRFDYRGIGDSAAPARDFEAVDADICAAIDTLVEQGGVEQVVVWGLCDAASAALMYPADERVAGLVLANPWVHSPQTEARARLRNYYVERLTSRDFWRKTVRLQLDLRDSVTSLAGYVSRMLAPAAGGAPQARHFVERMRDGLAGFTRPVFLILSGDDLTAREFRELCDADATWRGLVRDRVTECRQLPDANHTFSSARWRGEVETQTIDWLRRIDRRA